MGKVNSKSVNEWHQIDLEEPFCNEIKAKFIPKDDSTWGYVELVMKYGPGIYYHVKLTVF